MPTTTPSTTGRIHSLDLARRIAILGTLASNIWIFSHIDGMTGYLHEPVTPGTPPALGVTQQVLLTLSNGKFLGLLTLMFGIGLEIQRRSMIRSGRRWPGGYLWRAGLLFLDGVVNYFLVIEFDVLMGYAVTGAVVAFLLTTSERGQRAWIWVVSSIHVVMMGLFTAASVLTENFTAGGGSAAGSTISTPYADGSFIDLVLYRIERMGVFRIEPMMIFGLSIAMFLIGAHLLRSGIFEERGAWLRRRLMIIGLAITWPVDIVVGAFTGGNGFALERYVLAPVVATGLLALIAHIGLHTSPTAWMSKRFQAVGRMALTGYILQNVIASIVFYGWGFGLAAALGPWRVPITLVAYVVICSLVVLFAHLWLRRFTQGPVEWLWRAGYQWLARA